MTREQFDFAKELADGKVSLFMDKNVTYHTSECVNCLYLIYVALWICHMCCLLVETENCQ
jgi:hypothetical protein